MSRQGNRIKSDDKRKKLAVKACSTNEEIIKTRRYLFEKKTHYKEEIFEHGILFIAFDIDTFILPQITNNGFRFIDYE